ncbi:kinase-like protein [Rhizophagus irregularis]|uniref:Kinase-like protein n=1 Tax=Rhizophagus irregularis TaxID=588596 RepID=A0A2I1FY55_9GLOM|nr:kinase-like protein [Rhizophagus irregularis]
MTSVKKWIEEKIKNEYIRYFEYDEFSPINEIGRGSFGKVIKANLANTGLVALKIIISKNSDEHDEVNDEFIKELKLLREVDYHPKINRCLGITKDSENYILVLEYANEGNLRKFLKKNFTSLKWNDKIQMALDITNGLKFLHSKGIIHRDLHSKNILVNDRKLLIADLGLSKKLAEATTHSKSNKYGMREYIEPQCFKNIRYKKDKKSDIYSLGVLLWEISSGRPPFSDCPRDLIKDHIKDGNREEPIEGTPTEYRKLYQECWDGKPESRPDIEKVHEILSQLLINTEASSQPNTIRNSYDNDDLTISSNYPSLNLINNQNLSTVLDKEFAEKENTSQAQIPCLQNEKQVLTDNLTEQLELELKQNFIKEETFQGQSALITNYRMDDDDKNRSVQLKRDIEELQNKLKCYVTTLKGDFEIDFKEVINLMGKYNIKTKITPKQPNKPLIKGVLQHHIIKTITKDIRKYFKGNLNEHSIIHLEKEIATTAKDLENKLNDFSKTRNGDDTITQSASIKVRQDVNIALGNRGFSDVLSNGNYTSHVYIIMKTTELNREMNKYRIIKDVIKRNYIEKLAPYLIREFTRIFQFRLKVQEPRAQMRWIKTESSIDPSIMEGNWDKDDIDNLEVEICSFPMIGRDLDDVDKRKIYTHAQIFTKRKKFYTKGMDYFTSKKAKVYLELESDDDSYNEVD